MAGTGERVEDVFHVFVFGFFALQGHLFLLGVDGGAACTSDGDLHADGDDDGDDNNAGEYEAHDPLDVAVTVERDDRFGHEVGTVGPLVFRRGLAGAAGFAEL